MVLIGLTGKKRSGKDTTADYLVEKYGFEKISFATPLKEICKILFSFSDNQLYGDEKEEIDKRWDISPRKVFQFIGTNLFRDRMSELIPNIEKNFWVKCTEEILESKLNKNIVVTDCRFDNEVNVIKKHKGYVFRINRENNNIDTHSSETEIENLLVDSDISNDTTKQDLFSKIDKIIHSIFLSNGKDC